MTTSTCTAADWRARSLRAPACGKIPSRLFQTREKVNLCAPEGAARADTDLSYGLAVRSGHFPAAEEPELLAADLREWFRRFRQSAQRS